MNAVLLETPAGQPRLRKRDLVLGAGLGAVVLAVVVVFGLRLESVTAKMGASILEVGAPAPGFTLPMADGKTISLEDLRGRPTWINFWATWCPPCRTEMPDLQDVYASTPPGSYNLVAVNVGEDQASVQQFLSQVGYDLPVALDESGEVSLEYSVLGLPTHFFIDRRGILQETYVGVLTKEEIQQRVAALW